MGMVIGKDGKTINHMQNKSGTVISKGGKNKFSVYGETIQQVEDCRKMIEEICNQLKTEVSIPEDKIGMVIGRDGANIKQIQADADVYITNVKGSFHIYGDSPEKLESALNMIEKSLSRSKVSNSTNQTASNKTGIKWKKRNK
jgi:polyribonucleotide nucleotidyltransferase